MPNWVQSFPKVDKAGTSLVWGLRCGRNKTMLRFGSINSVFMSSGKLLTGNSLLWDRYTVSRRLEIVFIFSKLVSQIIFQIQFGLSYQREIHHKNKWNVIQSLRYIFFPENLIPWQPYNAFSCTPKNPAKAIVLLIREQVGEIFSNCGNTCYQEWSSKYVS